MNFTSQTLYKLWDEVFDYKHFYNGVAQEIFFDNVSQYRNYLQQQVVTYNHNVYKVSNISTMCGSIFFNIENEDTYRDDVSWELLCLKQN